MKILHRCLCWALSLSVICYSVLPAYAQATAQARANPEQQGYQQALDDSGNFRALSAQWLEFTLIAPGGAERTIKRYVIERIGAANRQQGHVALANFTQHEEAVWRLARNNSFLLNPGAYSEAYIPDRYLERLIQSRPLLEFTLHNSWFPNQTKDISPELMNLTGKTTELWLSDAIEMKSETNPGVVDYRYEPGLLIINSGLHDAESGSSEQLVVPTTAAAAVLTVEVTAGVAGAANIGIARGVDVCNALGGDSTTTFLHRINWSHGSA